MVKQKTCSNQFSEIKFLKYSFIFGLCYWAMEAVRDVITFNRGTIIERFFMPDSRALWMRVLVVCVIFLFGVVSDSFRNRRKSVLWKTLLRSDWTLVYVAIVFSLFYWVFEAFRDAYIYGNDSFFELVFSPSPIMLWMRMMAIFFIILYGLYVQISVNDLRGDERVLQHEQLRLEKLLQSKSLELGEARALILHLRKEIEKRKYFESENTKIQEQLIQAQKVEAIGVVAGGIAHDFNNLMTAVLGVSTLALKDIPADSPLYRDLLEIKVAAGRAAELTRQLLLFSHEQPMKFKALDVNRTIHELRKILQSLIGEDIQLEFMLGNSHSVISGDKGALEQMIINLVVNGRDALIQGGEIIIRTKTVQLDEKKSHQYSRGKPGEYLCLSVSDNGTGMSPQIAEKIFEPFFSTKSPGEGTGLGLSVVDQIIKKHNGWIHVNSVPGRGTVFSIFLPVIVSHVHEQDEKSLTFENQHGNGKRILLVEDEEGVREFACRALRQQGYVVMTAGSANEAKRLFKNENGSFDLIFSDVVLPDKSGVDMILDFKNDFPGLSVLLCSGHNDTKSQWSMIKKYGFPFLKKPFELNELLKGIQEAVN
ncbi:ATP-binding protein [bacterium]